MSQQHSSMWVSICMDLCVCVHVFVCVCVCVCVYVRAHGTAVINNSVFVKYHYICMTVKLFMSVKFCHYYVDLISVFTVLWAILGVALYRGSFTYDCNKHKLKLVGKYKNTTCVVQTVLLLIVVD